MLYRINTLTLIIPPLRERKEDLPDLIEFFVRKTELDQKKKQVQIDDDVMEQLLCYDYPGNIRELKNIIERMIALSREGRVTMNEFLMPGSGNYPVFGIAGGGETVNLRDARGAFEKNYIAEALRRNDWNVEKSALVLGITSRQLWNKIGQYGLQRPEV